MKKKYFFNLYKAFYAYNHKKTHLPYPPVMGSVEPSSICNLNCVMCAMDKVNRKKGIMSLDTFENIINSGAHIRTMDFTGHGESLLNKNLEYFVKRSKTVAERVGLTTNATLLDMDRSNDLLFAGLDWICLSFEDVNKQVYESIRVGANYDAVESNIKSFIMLKNMMVKNCKVILVVVDSPLTHDSLDKIQSKWIPLVDTIKIVPIHDWGGILDSSLIQQSREVRPYPCFEAWYHVYVRWDGSVVPCCLWEGKTDFGNINEQPIMDIWNSETYKSFRKSLLNNPEDHCRYCHLDLLGSVFPLGKPEPTFPLSKGAFELLVSGFGKVIKR